LKRESSEIRKKWNPEKKFTMRQCFTIEMHFSNSHNGPVDALRGENPTSKQMIDGT
jgi:hypothetical protein